MSAGAPADPVAQLAPGLQAVALQQGEVVLLGPEGQPSAITHVPAGWYYTETGHHRLTLAVAQLQSDRAAAEARASAFQEALSTRNQPSSGCYPEVLVGLLLLAVGVLVGRYVVPPAK